jgi:hypothetical protein
MSQNINQYINCSFFNRQLYIVLIIKLPGQASQQTVPLLPGVHPEKQEKL